MSAAPGVGRATIDEVKDRTSIREVISRWVALKPSGRNLVGLCPFHDENTPSFNVNEERAFYHCFGCGEGGDVFSFLEKIEGLTFFEVLEKLAGEAGIELPRDAARGERSDHRERLRAAAAAAAEFYRRCLWESKVGAGARAYLEGRGVGEAIAQAYDLGYAPQRGLLRYLENREFTIADAETLGLVGRGDRGQAYDRFRDRLVFPITDPPGRVIAFGGRALADDAGPKYLNTHESPLFHKSRNLFGLSAARETLRRSGRAVVVEGYIDVIALAQAGIGDAVAPLGTAFTGEQARLLGRYAETIVIVFDGDEAGRRAAARAFPGLAEVGVFAEAAFLPPGEDPDSYVRSAGAEAFERLVTERRPLLDHYLERLAPPAADLASRRRAAKTVSELIARLRDPIVAGLVARRSGDHLGLPEEGLLADARNPRNVPRVPSPPPPPDPGEKAPNEPSPPTGEESLVIELLTLHPELAGMLSAETVELFESDGGRALLEALRGPDPPRTVEVLERLPTSSRDRLSRALVGDAEAAEIYDSPGRMLEDAFTRLQARRWERESREIHARIRDAEARGDRAELDRLLAAQRTRARRRS